MVAHRGASNLSFQGTAVLSRNAALKLTFLVRADTPNGNHAGAPVCGQYQAS
jgi:hypothetical protein